MALIPPKPRPKRPKPHVPPVIASDEALAAHIAALIGVDARFAALHEVAGDVPLRWLDPGFKGLVRVIAGQQISAAAGHAIFTRCEAALGPGATMAETLLAADDAALRTTGLSTPKIRTLRAVAEAIRSGALDLDGLLLLETEVAVERLCAVKGIGRWTAEVYLLFAAGHPDIFPAGDLALKDAARQGFALPERPAEKAFAAMALQWQPYRSAAARLLWAYYAAVKRGGKNAAPA